MKDILFRHASPFNHSPETRTPRNSQTDSSPLIPRFLLRRIIQILTPYVPRIPDRLFLFQKQNFKLNHPFIPHELLRLIQPLAFILSLPSPPNPPPQKIHRPTLYRVIEVSWREMVCSSLGKWAGFRLLNWSTVRFSDPFSSSTPRPSTSSNWSRCHRRIAARSHGYY